MIPSAVWRQDRHRVLALSCCFAGVLALIAGCAESPVKEIPAVPAVAPAPAEPVPVSAPASAPAPVVNVAETEKEISAEPAQEQEPAPDLWQPRVLHVAPSGSDELGDGTEAKPLASLKLALSLVRPGDTVYLRAGRYPAVSIVRPGRADAWITLRAWPHERVVIEAKGAEHALQVGLPDGRPMYWRIEGLAFSGGSRSTVKVQSPQVHLVQNRWRDADGDLLEIADGADEVVIHGNQFRNGKGVGIRVHAAANAWLVSNYLADLAGTAVTLVNSSSTLVERNLIERAAAGGIAVHQHASAVARNNIVVASGTCMSAHGSAQLLHNSCIDSAAGAAIELTAVADGRLSVLNNLVSLPAANAAALRVSEAGPDAGEADLEIDGNLYWQRGGREHLHFDWVARGLSRASFEQWRQLSGQDANSRRGKPRFAAEMNYRPTIDSAAIGVGVANSGVIEDYRGLPRGAMPIAGAVALGIEEPERRVVKRDRLQRYPYLQAGGDGSISITWAGGADPAHCRVRVHDLAKRLVAEVVPEVHVLSARETGLEADLRQYRARVRGLAPGTEYLFKIVDNGDHLVQGLAFKTLPAAGANKLQFVAFGDSGIGSEQPRRVRDAITARDADGGWRYPHDLVMAVGDIAYNKGSFADFRQRFFQQLSGWQDDKLENSLITHRPFFSALGNHEYGNKLERLPQAYLSAFDYPRMAGVPVEDEERYYSFDSGPVHFVVLDSMKAVTGDPNVTRLAQMRDWLKADLAASQQPWKIAFFHHSPLSFGPHGTWGDQQENARIRQQLLRDMQDLGVQLVMFGHDHMYQRTVPMRIDDDGRIARRADGSIVTDGGVVYVGIGNGGADLHKRQTQPSQYGSRLWKAQRSQWGIGYDFIARRKDGAPVLYDSIDEDMEPPTQPGKRWGFAHVQIESDSLELSAYNFFGELMDRFHIVRH